MSGYPQAGRVKPIKNYLVTGSKRKTDFLEERKPKKRKVSPSIVKHINFFEGKFTKTHNTKLGTAQHARMGSSDLAGQSSDSTARSKEGGKGKLLGAETLEAEE